MSPEAHALRDLIQFSTDDYEQMLALAVDCYGASRFLQAETLLVGLMALEATDPRPVKLLASIMLIRERESEAEAMYERAMALEPDDPYTLVALGEIKLRSLRLDEAVPLFEKLFAMDPKGEHPAANRGRQLVRHYHQKLVGT